MLRCQCHYIFVLIIIVLSFCTPITTFVTTSTSAPTHTAAVQFVPPLTAGNGNVFIALVIDGIVTLVIVIDGIGGGCSCITAVMGLWLCDCDCRVKYYYLLPMTMTHVLSWHLSHLRLLRNECGWLVRVCRPGCHCHATMSYTVHCAVWRRGCDCISVSVAAYCVLLRLAETAKSVRTPSVSIAHRKSVLFCYVWCYICVCRLVWYIGYFGKLLRFWYNNPIPMHRAAACPPFYMQYIYIPPTSDLGSLSLPLSHDNKHQQIKKCV